MTAYELRISDWSSDVCSSDLRVTSQKARARAAAATRMGEIRRSSLVPAGIVAMLLAAPLPAAAFDAPFDARVLDSVVSVDRKSVVERKSVSVRVDLGGAGIIKKKKV